MSRCDEIRERLSAYLDGELEARDARDVERHLAGCQECADLGLALELVSEAVTPFRHLAPPPHLEADLVASPCRRWLGLLMSAIDRDIDKQDLDRLLGHLEGCPSCTRIWTDLALVHQVSEAMLPPAGLAERCAAVRRQPRVRRIISRRAAVAAAYALAVLASLVVGNPVSIARSPVVQRVASSVTEEVGVVAEEGRGELRVMMWRAWRWGNSQVAAIRDMLNPGSDASDVIDVSDDSDTTSDQGEAS
jgi:predicted anti-sigma-YlaC factor YlaD